MKRVLLVLALLFTSLGVFASENVLQSIEIEPKMLKTNLLNRLFRALVRIFAPML